MRSIKLKPHLKNTIWGGQSLKTLFNFESHDNIAEAWCVSKNKAGLSFVESGQFCGLDFCEYLEKTQNDFPLLLKYISSAQNLSVQVHPDDNLAKQLDNQLNGKSEFWYAIDCEPNCFAYCGFKKDISRQEFLARLKEGSLVEILNKIPLEPSDCVFVPPRTIHFLGGGLTVLEISQDCDLTYRIFDFARCDENGKKRGLHLQKALKTLNFCATRQADIVIRNQNAFKKTKNAKQRAIFCNQHFKIQEWLVDGFVSTRFTKNTAVNIVSGFGELNGEPFFAGDTFFVPYSTNFDIKGKCRLILSQQ